MHQDELQQIINQVDPSQIQTVICTHCKGETWLQVYNLNRLSPIISPTGEEIIFPSPTFKCGDCNKLVDSIK